MNKGQWVSFIKELKTKLTTFELKNVLRNLKIYPKENPFIQENAGVLATVNTIPSFLFLVKSIRIDG